MTCEEQLRKWIAGTPKHNNERDECCPDFSCCNPELLVPLEIRLAFKNASEKERYGMLGAFLGAAIVTHTKKKVYLAGVSA